MRAMVLAVLFLGACAGEPAAEGEGEDEPARRAWKCSWTARCDGVLLEYPASSCQSSVIAAEREVCENADCGGGVVSGCESICLEGDAEWLETCD
jgi:hypothetical protein